MCLADHGRGDWVGEEMELVVRTVGLLLGVPVVLSIAQQPPWMVSVEDLALEKELVSSQRLQ